MIHSKVDSEGPWVKKADQSILLEGHPVEVYLDYENIIKIAKEQKCTAIHPGYGFLSESADFARACEKNGIIFIGPKAEHIELFGDKITSKNAKSSSNNSKMDKKAPFIKKKIVHFLNIKKNIDNS